MSARLMRNAYRRTGAARGLSLDRSGLHLGAPKCRNGAQFRRTALHSLRAFPYPRSDAHPRVATALTLALESSRNYIRNLGTFSGTRNFVEIWARFGDSATKYNFGKISCFNAGLTYPTWQVEAGAER